VRSNQTEFGTTPTQPMARRQPSQSGYGVLVRRANFAVGYGWRGGILRQRIGKHASAYQSGYRRSPHNVLPDCRPNVSH